MWRGTVTAFWAVRSAIGPCVWAGPRRCCWALVHPTRQGEGLGGVLMHVSLQVAAEMGWARVMLVGDAPYYQRFGFTRLDHVVMPPPTNPDRVLGRALVAGAWDGVQGDVLRWDAVG